MANIPLTLDQIELTRLMADVAAAKASGVRQRQLLVDGLQRIFKTKIGWLLVADNFRPGKPIVMLHQVLTSDATPEWVRYMGEISVRYPFDADVYGVHALNCNDEVFVLKRRELLPDADAEKKYAACMDVIRLVKVGDAAVAAYRIGKNLDRLVGFAMHRDENAPDFTAAEFALVRLAIEELRDLERRGHVEFRDAVPIDLPPRLGQILDQILSGKSAKRIAHDLNLSIHTVREHFQRLYGIYSVNNREELTAMFQK